MKKPVPQNNTKTITQNNVENHLDLEKKSKDSLGKFKERLVNELNELEGDFKANEITIEDLPPESEVTSSTTTTTTSYETETESNQSSDDSVSKIEREDFVKNTDEKINRDLDNLEYYYNAAQELQEENDKNKEEAEKLYQDAVKNKDNNEQTNNQVNEISKDIKETSIEIKAGSEVVEEVSVKVSETNQEMNTQVTSILDKVSAFIQKIEQMNIFGGGGNYALITALIGVAAAAGGYYAKYHGMHGFTEIMGRFFWSNIRNGNTSLPTPISPVTPVIPTAPSDEDTLDLLKQWVESSNKVVFGLMKALIDTIKIFRDKNK